MASPIFNALRGNSPVGQAAQMKRAFDQFRQTFTGSPEQARQIVMQKLQSGEISQQQLNQVQQMAQGMAWLMGRGNG